jgi:glutamate racemase
LYAQNGDIDTLLLACTHYPLLLDKIAQRAPAGTTIVSQGNIVADSLIQYLQRHPQMENRISKAGNRSFFTTDDVTDFDEKASIFYGEKVSSSHVHLG